MTAYKQERSVAELFGQLSQDVGLLVRQEAQLAKTEVQEKVTRATGNLVSLAAGGLVALIGGLAWTAAVIRLLVDPVGLDPWLAAALVGALLAVVGSVRLRRGLQELKRMDPTPRRTVETIKEDIQWAKEQRP
ncbi:MAG: phage holin family protein [Gemmatimonadales bacterium]